MNQFFKKIKENTYLKFAFGSIIIFFFELFVTILLTEYLDIHENISFAVALILGLYLLFYYHKKITFHLCYHSKYTIIKFITIYSAIYILNWFSVELLNLKINYIISIPVTAVILSLLSYWFNRDWVFKIDPSKETVCKINLNKNRHINKDEA